jgi:hypothetical protein
MGWFPKPVVENNQVVDLAVFRIRQHPRMTYRQPKNQAMTNALLATKAIG